MLPSNEQSKSWKSLFGKALKANISRYEYQKFNMLFDRVVHYSPHLLTDSEQSEIKRSLETLGKKYRLYFEAVEVREKDGDWIPLMEKAAECCPEAASELNDYYAKPVNLTDHQNLIASIVEVKKRNDISKKSFELHQNKFDYIQQLSQSDYINSDNEGKLKGYIEYIISETSPICADFVYDILIEHLDIKNSTQNRKRFDSLAEEICTATKSYADKTILWSSSMNQDISSFRTFIDPEFGNLSQEEVINALKFSSDSGITSEENSYRALLLLGFKSISRKYFEIVCKQCDKLTSTTNVSHD